MAHRFDNGEPLSLRMLARRSAAFALSSSSIHTANGGYLAGVVELPAPLVLSDADAMRMVARLLDGRSPSIGVALGSERFKSNSTDGTRWTSELSIHVYTFTRSSRDPIAGLAGDDVTRPQASKDPGAEVVMQHAIERLAGRVLGGVFGGDVFGALRIESCEPAYFDGEWHVWEMLFRVPVQYDLRPNRDVAGVAKEVLIDHELAGATTPAQAITELEPPS